MKYDVVIAGAGPAGSVAALILSRAGKKVLVVEKDSFPRAKICGYSMNPRGCVGVAFGAGAGVVVRGTAGVCRAAGGCCCATYKSS